MGVLASVLVGYIPAPRLWFVSKSCHVSRARACTLLGKMAAATPSPLKRSRRAVANEAPPVPDVGQAWGADFVAGAAAELRDDQLVPLCPGMQPAPKPSCFNMTRLHRSKVPPVPSGPGKGSKPNYRGLPRKYALGVPVIRLHAKGWLDSLPPETHSELAGRKHGFTSAVTGLIYGPSKFLAWLCRTVELSQEQLTSKGELHVRIFTRRSALGFKEAMDARGFKASTMGHILYSCADYCEFVVGSATRVHVSVLNEATLCNVLLRKLSHRYSKYAKKDSAAWKRAADLNAGLGCGFHQSQVQGAFADTLLGVIALLDKYSMGGTAIPVLQHPASTLRSVQLYLVTLVSIAMCIPRGKVISTFKLAWLTKTGDSYSINPGEDAATFKNGTWRAGSTLVRPELAKAIEKYVNLTWPLATALFKGGRGDRATGAAVNLSAGTAAARQVVHALHGQCTSSAAYNKLRKQSPVFFAGVPDALDDTSSSLRSRSTTQATAFVQVAELLADRTGAGAIEEYCTNECLKHVFVSWLGVYDSTSQNSFRHMAAWWMYQEWHEQLECDVQGFPNQFAGKSYEQHVQRAADMMDHTVEIHETTYLPVSPSHRTAQEEVAATAAAQPLSSLASTAVSESESESESDDCDEDDGFSDFVGD